MQRIYRMLYYLWNIEKYTVAARSARRLNDERLKALTDQVARQYNDITWLKAKLDLLQAEVTRK